MRLKYQLFVILLAASALLILLMFAISSWSFSRGFLGYINNAEQQQLQPILDDLAERYERDGNWAWAEGDSREWKALLSAHGRNRHRRGRRSDSVMDWNTDSNSDQSSNPGNVDRSSNVLTDKPEPQHRHGSRSKGKPAHILANHNKRIVAGPSVPADLVSWLPVISSDDQVVGYLGIRKITRLNSSLDQAFDYQQRNSFAWAALAMGVLSALISIPLASWLVKPLLYLNSAISEVSQGNYSHRVRLKRKDEIADLANGINSLANTLEVNRDARRRWVAEISHELRTPVAVLQGELEAIQDGVRQMGTDSVDSIHAEIRKLAHLIDDLHQLSLADVGALEYSMQRLCLGDLVESQVQIGKKMLAEAGLQLTIDLPAKPYLINADERRLSQLISNLLQNSLRYTDSPGNVRIVLTQTTDCVTLVWEDSSPGVANDELSQLFEPLYRAEQSRNREYGGAGLGLSIATRIVQAHTGSIDASQSSIGGLKLVIEFPAAAEV